MPEVQQSAPQQAAPQAPQESPQSEGSPQGQESQQGLSDNASIEDALEHYSRNLQGISDRARGIEPEGPEGASANEEVGSENGGSSEGSEGSESLSALPKLKKPPAPSAESWAKFHRGQKEMQSERAAFQKEKAEWAAAIEEGHAEKGGNPWKALELLGYKDGMEFLEKVAQNQGQPSPEQKKIRELEAWKQKQEQAAKAREEEAAEAQRQREYTENVDKWHKGIQNYAKSSEQWRESLVTLPGAEQQVLAKIQKYHESGEEPVLDDVLSETAKELESNLGSLLTEIAGTPRGRALLEEFAGKLNPQAKRGKATARTLSGQVRNSTPISEESDLSLDDAVDQNARWLTQMQRSGRL